MRKKIALFALLAGMSFFLLDCANNRGGGSSGGAAVGMPAPSFRLQDLQGKEISLDQFRGKIVMLDFWATWCGPCRQSMPVLEKLQEDYPQDFRLLAVNLMETPDEVRDYVRRQNITSTVLLDTEGEVGGAYGSESIPMRVLIDQEGVVRHVQVGYGAGVGNLLRREIERLRSGN